jgi:hypothetical protein
MSSQNIDLTKAAFEWLNRGRAESSRARKLGLGVAAVLVGAAMAIPPDAGARVTTLRLVAINTSIALVDVPPLQTAPSQPPTPGDVIVLRYRDLSAGRTVGYTREACTVIDFPHLICQASLSLRGGHLIISDQFNAASRAPQRFAVTGGTGLYANARGQGTIRLLSRTREVLTVAVVT